MSRTLKVSRQIRRLLARITLNGSHENSGWGSRAGVTTPGMFASPDRIKEAIEREASAMSDKACHLSLPNCAVATNLANRLSVLSKYFGSL
jgi:hypothetical protein